MLVIMINVLHNNIACDLILSALNLIIFIDFIWCSNMCALVPYCAGFIFRPAVRVFHNWALILCHIGVLVNLQCDVQAHRRRTLLCECECGKRKASIANRFESQVARVCFKFFVGRDDGHRVHNLHRLPAAGRDSHRRVFCSVLGQTEWQFNKNKIDPFWEFLFYTQYKFVRINKLALRFERLTETRVHINPHRHYTIFVFRYVIAIQNKTCQSVC